jgi:ActR/RegA family two-component response regulator
MTAEAFQRWLAEMRISASEAARLLGVHPNTITKYKAKGGPRIVALACAALFHRMEVWR